MIDPHQLSAHLFRELHRHPIVPLLQHCAFIALLTLYLLPELTSTGYLVWLGLVLFGVLWQWLLSRRFSRQIAGNVKMQNIDAFTMASLAAGLGFGLVTLLLPQLSFTTQIFVIVMLSVIAASELLRLSAYPPIYAAFLGGLTLPLIFTLSMSEVLEGLPGWELIPIVLLMVLMLYYSALQRRHDLIDDLMSRFGLENDAGEDRLTRIPNRRRFDLMLEQVWAQARRGGFPVSVIMVDIDYFKKYNDRYGHQEGDKCLALVARTLSDVARRATDLVARYGGEEFVILLNQTPRDDAYAIAQRMCKAVEDLKLENRDAPLGRVTISLGGVTLFAREEQAVDNPVKLADMALYEAKGAGRNRVNWYRSTLAARPAAGND